MHRNSTQSNSDLLVEETQEISEKLDSQISLSVSIRNALYILVTFAVIAFIMAIVSIAWTMLESRNADRELDKTMKAINSLYE